MADHTSYPDPRSNYQSSAKPRGRKRVQAACDRCRRQKLRCDKERPCAMCLRSEVECVTDVRTGSRRETRSAVLARGRLGHANASTADPREQQVEARPGHTNDRIDGPDVEQFHPATSSVGWTQQILREFDPHSKASFNSPTDALPGGIRAAASPAHNRSTTSSISDLLGMELPPNSVLDYLLETYLKSVHWFMLMFHEPTFRQRYEEMTWSGRIPRSKFRRLALVLLVLAIGARYVKSEDFGRKWPQVDLDGLHLAFMAKIKSSLFEVLDEGDLEAVQICTLLSFFYIYHGSPNLAFIMLGTGVRCAQAMGLHRQSTWLISCPIAREERKCVWWALYVFDRFASTVFGKPCMISDLEWDVSMPKNIHDEAVQNSTSSSTDSYLHGQVDIVTIFSYQLYKFQLYQIASPIVRDIYLYRGTDIQTTASKIQAIHARLIEWFNTLPPELKLAKSHTAPRQDPDTETTLALQAFVLQLAYDNIQIVLHRPLLSYTVNHTEVGNRSQTAQSTSRNQCWESAIRTSHLLHYEECLHAICETHAAAYIGIHIFTAGIVLSVFALSNPLSTQSQEAKQALARIIRMTRIMENHTAVSSQSGRILEGLVRLILSKEMSVLLPQRRDIPQGEADASDSVALCAPSASQTVFNEPPRSHLHTGSSQGAHNPEMFDNGDNDETWRTDILPTLGDSVDHNLQYLSPGTILGDIDFTEGIRSLQEVIQQKNTFTSEAQSQNLDPGNQAYHTNANALNDLSQTWVWDFDNEGL